MKSDVCGRRAPLAGRRKFVAPSRMNDDRRADHGAARVSPTAVGAMPRSLDRACAGARAPAGNI